ncbi:hypothetical protein H257_18206 [Aphanomyces astaci]|uniref:Core-binding (CB) domain-containing protein n=1 Tax=Aphanomyces astaci TaxID=112090 RepID=W4FBZ4_APHAT|nr:hypothetical protein H257_18206 [Aphanomyces astaci]ETV65002.1 hypothetical protein H257_18206 [Aphanomyces astaci]|eukprot:XP_009845527.1 hypothetical protein H257_18206 [Aphanomyces astaci]
MEDEPRNDVSTRQQSITVQDLRDNRLAEGSKKGYLSGVRQVVAWLRESGRSGTINPDGSINLDVFSYEDFTEFVLYKYKSAGVSLSTLSGYRSAIKDYYSRQNVALSAGFVTDATAIYQGIRRLCASETQTGAIKPGGKQPLRYHQYQELCRASLTKLDAGFTHLFLTLSWNLMCRSRSTETVRVDHLSDEGDSIGVTFFKSKTDQGGTKRRDPKHLTTRATFFRVPRSVTDLAAASISLLAQRFLHQPVPSELTLSERELQRTQLVGVLRGPRLSTCASGAGGPSVVLLNATYIMTAPVTNTWAALWLVFHLTAVSLLHYLLTLILAVTKQFPLPGH